MEDRRQRVADSLRTVWAERHGELLDRVAVMEAAVASVRARRGHDAELLARAQREAHRLAGVVGTFGMPLASQLATDLERRLGRDLREVEEVEIGRLALDVARLRELLERAPALSTTGVESRLLGGRAAVVVLGDPDDLLVADVLGEAQARRLDATVVQTLDEAVVAADRTWPAVLVVARPEGPTDADLEVVEHLGSLPFPTPSLIAGRDVPIDPERIVETVSVMVLVEPAVDFRVLVLAQDAEAADAIEVLLRLDGISVDQSGTTDGRDLAERVAATEPDLVIADQAVDVGGVPFMMLVRQGRTQAELEVAYASGAIDHIALPLVGTAVRRGVRTQLERAALRRRRPTTP